MPRCFLVKKIATAKKKPNYAELEAIHASLAPTFPYPPCCWLPVANDTTWRAPQAVCISTGGNSSTTKTTVATATATAAAAAVATSSMPAIAPVPKVKGICLLQDHHALHSCSFHIASHRPASIFVDNGLGRIVGPSETHNAPAYETTSASATSTSSISSYILPSPIVASLCRFFRCKHCDRSYSSMSALKMHIRTHTLPCVCNVCGKAFSRPWLLQGHVRTHTGEKPFSCSYCLRAFADRSNLRAHLQTHQKVKRHQCAVCSRTFSRLSLLEKHKKALTCISPRSDQNG